jgi:hypothetical protein
MVKLIQNIPLLYFPAVSHAPGSQDWICFGRIKMKWKDIANKMPAVRKRIALYLESEKNHGIEIVRDARVIPIPSVIKSAGRAQHKSVPNELNKERTLRMVRFLFAFTSVIVLTKIGTRLHGPDYLTNRLHFH